MKSRPFGKCQLCFQERELDLSHITPAFVTKYLKESSVTGHIRSSVDPNVRKQGGDPQPTFCRQCEDLMSAYETYFSKVVFYPLHNDDRKSFEYDSRLSGFATIQAYRTLIHYRSGNSVDNNRLSPSIRRRLDAAQEQMRNQILTRSFRDSDYTNHLIFCSLIESIGADVPPVPSRLNFYQYRSIDLTIVFTGSQIYIYSKSCRALLVTFVVPKNPKDMIGTRLFDSGVIGSPQKMGYPGFGQLLFQRAEEISSAYENISPKQHAIILSDMDRNKHRLPNSPGHKAVEADSRLQSLRKKR
jgi:hypothetical protein